MADLGAGAKRVRGCSLEDSEAVEGEALAASKVGKMKKAGPHGPAFFIYDFALCYLAFRQVSRDSRLCFFCDRLLNKLDES